MDILELDYQVLEDTAAIIVGYCNEQKSIMSEYMRKVSSLSSEWTDDQTLGPLLEEICRMKNSVTDVMNEIMATYPKYFREKAEQIRNRPKM